MSKAADPAAEMRQQVHELALDICDACDIPATMCAKVITDKFTAFVLAEVHREREECARAACP